MAAHIGTLIVNSACDRVWPGGELRSPLVHKIHDGSRPRESFEVQCRWAAPVDHRGERNDLETPRHGARQKENDPSDSGLTWGRIEDCAG